MTTETNDNVKRGPASSYSSGPVEQVDTPTDPPTLTETPDESEAE